MKKSFILRPEHVKILSVTNWYWIDCESGAPGMDGKRPFGNSGKTSICHDIKEILGVQKGTPCPHCGEDITDTEEHLEEYWTIYSELATAAEVILQAQSFSVGDYHHVNGRWAKA